MTTAPQADRPSLLDIIAAFFAAERARELEPGLVYFGPCDRPAPEPEAEASP